VVIDYSSPNMAKEMHVGHLRTTVIGDSLVRLLDFIGDDVIRQNHLGDWGTPFGILVEHLIDEGLDEATDLSIADLNEFYRQARAKFDADPDFANRARRRVVALQSGDEATLALWLRLVAESKRHAQAVYRLLGVLLTPDDDRGESFYNPVLPWIAEELTEKGLAEISDGALCAFPEGFRNREGGRMALIVRKSDGGYTYDTTDLATIRFRAQTLKGDDLVYVVGAPQRLHFEMIFATAREAGWLGDHVATTYVSFGSVLGEDGRMLKTRSGEFYPLIALLESAVERAAGLLMERSQLEPEEIDGLARAVGIGAVKYADLSIDRDKDYVFSLDRMLAMDGNTSVYLQYANARIRSILRKAGREDALEASISVEQPSERRLLLELAQFPEAVEQTVRTLEPHRLCTYLFDTAVAFTSFYEHCSVLGAETDEIRASRLALCSLTSKVLTKGLSLLGIEAPERL
jgi:arginyl-tRNA synthetase